jgi:iron complex transport system substrate-binding protein
MGRQPSICRLPRRAFLGGVISLAFSPAARADLRRPLRLAALDWTSGQNLLALSANLISMPERSRYQQRVVEPELPADTYELGLRSEPNLELLDTLAPDLIVMHPELELFRPKLETIAPILAFDPDMSDVPERPDRILAARTELEKLAGSIAMADAFASYRTVFEAEISAAKARLQDYDGRPVYIVTLLDTRRALVFGKNSLFQSIFDLFGIENAWDGPTSAYGHATVTIDALAGRPDARLLSVGRESGLLLQAAIRSPVIASLPYVRENRATAIEDVLFYGGLPSAQRFARLASLALTDDASR